MLPAGTRLPPVLPRDEVGTGNFTWLKVGTSAASGNEPGKGTFSWYEVGTGPYWA